jgi:hypothetical protein
LYIVNVSILAIQPGREAGLLLVAQFENGSGLIHHTVILPHRTFSGFPHLDRVGAGAIYGGVMTGHTQLAITPRDRFLEAALKELAAFEQREREFSRKEWQERASELQIPAQKNELHG